MVELIVESELTGTRDGLTQLQRRWRPAEGPPRSAVVLVHGIGEHSGRYDHVGRHLAEQGHDVLGFDQRGFGQSGGRRAHVDDFDQYLDDVEDLVVERRQLGVPVVLLGHSLGGLIALTYVVRGRPEPDLLVLSAPALAAEVARWQRMAAPLLSRVAPKLFVPGDIDPSILSRDPAVQSAHGDDPLRVAGATARLGNSILETMAATTSAARQLTVPTYVLHGGADELVPPGSTRFLADGHDVTYRLWPGCRHECFNETNREDVLDDLSDWLDRRLSDGSVGERSSAEA